MASNDISIAGLQLANRDCQTTEDRDFNLQLAADTIEKDDGRSDLYVLSELYTSGYSDTVMQQLDVLAEDVCTGPSAQFFSKLAKRVGSWICYGFPRRSAAGSFFISHAVLNSSGELVTYYDKMHLCHFGDCAEKTVFTRGKKGCVFSIKGVRLGLFICYDMRFPELTRWLTWNQGAEVLIHPVAMPRDTAFAAWHSFAVTRASENQVYLLSINRAGSHFGGSIAVPPWFDDASGADKASSQLGIEPGVLRMVVQCETLRQVRQDFSFRQDALLQFSPEIISTAENPSIVELQCTPLFTECTSSSTVSAGQPFTQDGTKAGERRKTE